MAYKKEFQGLEKELSESLNKVAKKGFAYCDEAVLTHECRMGYDLEDHGQHMAIRFEKVDFIPEYRVYLGPIICIDDKEIAKKEANVKKAKVKVGCRTKYPNGEQYLNFYNDEYNDETVKAANKIYRLEEPSPDRKVSGFPFFAAQSESESNRKYKDEIEKQFEEDLQLFAKDGFRFQQLITIPVNGKERTALLFSKTGTKTISFSGESVFLDGFELWYKPIVRGRLRKMFERILPDYFEKKDQKHQVHIYTDIEDTERLEAVYTKAFNDQTYSSSRTSQIQIPITIISKTKVPHFGEDVEHLFLSKSLYLRGLIYTEVFRKITKQMISKAAAVKKVSVVEKDSNEGIWSEDKNQDVKNESMSGVRALKKEYRRNMRVLTKPHVDVFTSSIAVTITDDNEDKYPTTQNRSEKHALIDEEKVSIPGPSAKESVVNEAVFSPSINQRLEDKKDGVVSTTPSKKISLKFIPIAIGGVVALFLIGALCSSLFKSCGIERSSDDAIIEMGVEEKDFASEQNDLTFKESSDEIMPDENEDHFFDGKYKYVGTINEKTSITMYLVIKGKDISGNYYYGSGSNGSITLSGTREGSAITLIETTADGKNTGKFVGEMDGLSFCGTFTNLSSGKESPFCVDQDGPDEAEEADADDIATLY